MLLRVVGAKNRIHSGHIAARLQSPSRDHRTCQKSSGYNHRCLMRSNPRAVQYALRRPKAPGITSLMKLITASINIITASSSKLTLPIVCALLSLTMTP
jgi:hypothetical protein